MNENLIFSSCADFTAKLASKAPTPGGGAAAALSGALGVSLCAMAANLTSGKKKFAPYEEDLSRISRDCEALRLRFLRLVEEDAAAFLPLSRAYAIPKEQPERRKLIIEASLRACAAPYAVLECCAVASALLEELSGKCSELMISDVGCGAAAIKAALESAVLNVLINTRGLPGNSEALLMEIKAEAIVHNCAPRMQKLSDDIRDRITRRNNG